MGIIIEGSDYKTMDRNLIQQVQEKEEEEKEDDVMGVPVCGANLTSPVFDTINYIREVHYKIGTRLYIEKAN